MPRSGVARSAVIAEHSFLRRVDARTKIALALAASSAVALPLAPLALVAACFPVLLPAEADNTLFRIHDLENSVEGRVLVSKPNKPR